MASRSCDWDEDSSVTGSHPARKRYLTTDSLKFNSSLDKRQWLFFVSFSIVEKMLHSDFLTKTFLIQIIIKMSQRLKLSWRHQLDWKDFNASETPQKCNGRKILNSRSKNRFKDNFFRLKIELKLQLEFLSNFFSTPFKRDHFYSWINMNFKLV